MCYRGLTCRLGWLYHRFSSWLGRQLYHQLFWLYSGFEVGLDVGLVGFAVAFQVGFAVGFFGSTVGLIVLTIDLMDFTEGFLSLP